MHGYIQRSLSIQIINSLNHFPVVALLGPRQCGKSTLAKELGKNINNFLYLDLESIRDLNKLEDPEFFFEINYKKIICLDEIQRKPELFSVLRSIVDNKERKIKIILLGSASPKIIKNSSETLAGRIVFHFLTPFTICELNNLQNYKINYHWLRGGFPESFLAQNDKLSQQWRNNFILTFIERDIPQLGFNLPSLTVRRFLTMCAHNNGQLLNQSKLGESLGLSHNVIRRYIEIFENTFILRSLMPYYKNIKKRIVKSPKVYIRDTGILHSLLDIEDFNNLIGHPIYGASWEGFAMEMLLSELPEWHPYFYRTNHGAEIDLILEKGQKKYAIEFKASTSPSPSKGFYSSMNDLEIEQGWIIAPVNKSFQVKKNIIVSDLVSFIKHIKK